MLVCLFFLALSPSPFPQDLNFRQFLRPDLQLLSIPQGVLKHSSPSLTSQDGPDHHFFKAFVSLQFLLIITF